jgi:hypothetical protein
MDDARVAVRIGNVWCPVRVVRHGCTRRIHVDIRQVVATGDVPIRDLLPAIEEAETIFAECLYYGDWPPPEPPDQGA